MMNGALIHAQDSAQLSGMYGDRHCKECFEGLMIQTAVVLSGLSLTGCIP